MYIHIMFLGTKNEKDFKSIEILKTIDFHSTDHEDVLSLSNLIDMNT